MLPERVIRWLSSSPGDGHWVCHFWSQIPATHAHSSVRQHLSIVDSASFWIKFVLLLGPQCNLVNLELMQSEKHEIEMPETIHITGKSNKARWAVQCRCLMHTNPYWNGSPLVENTNNGFSKMRNVSLKQPKPLEEVWFVYCFALDREKNTFQRFPQVSVSAWKVLLHVLFHFDANNERYCSNWFHSHWKDATK